jgi:hypothetical protein
MATMSEAKIAAFEKDVLLPAYTEVSKAPALLRDYTAEIVTVRPHPNAAIEELLTSLAGALRRRDGPSMIIANRARPEGLAKIGGYYALTAMYDVQGDDVYAAPGVMFWMKFNNKLHAFAHRYDNAIAQHDVAKITKHQVLNHVLASFDFYKLYAFRDEPFPGYR